MHHVFQVLRGIGWGLLGFWIYLWIGAMLAFASNVEYSGINDDGKKMLTMLFWPIAPIIEIFKNF